MVPNSRQQKNWLALTNTIDLTSRLTVGTSFNYVYEYLFNVPAEGYSTQTAASFNQFFQRNVETEKLKRYKRADGTYTTWNITSPTNLTAKFWDNPYTEVNENIAHNYIQRLYGNAFVSLKLLPGLKLSAIARGNFQNVNGDARIASYTLGTPRFATSESKFRETNFVGSAEYEKTFSDFTLNAAVLGELMTQQTDVVNASTNGGFILPNVYNVSNSLGEKQRAMP
ncbi:hypothetical protein [Paraflavitalea speifideaquila]|uniref:hypothetical protein n=1 Tax=Paraflavitalea speifideaquila TaxID=3076558 RepID=UPI0028EF9B64|nr:hypothetical protein [Paraflavitalea speifideiaquila]